MRAAVLAPMLLAASACHTPRSTGARRRITLPSSAQQLQERAEREPLVPADDPLRVFLEDGDAIVWTSVASIFGSDTEQCIDGRSDRPHVGAPGGDVGELVLALAALEHVSGREVREERVAPALAAYAASFGRFYLHTDAHALERLSEDLRNDARFDAVRDHEIEDLVRHPPAALEDALLEHLVRPEHVGCGHLRAIIDHPSEYGARRALVQSVLRETYRLGWSRPDALELVVLEGEHEERAVVRVWLDRPIHAYTRVPTIPGAAEHGASFFVVHPEVTAYMRREVGSFLLESEVIDGALDAPGQARYARALDAFAERQSAATLQHLARELPVYDVHVSDERSAPVVSGPHPTH